MKIVDRQTFLSMPNGTVYQKVELGSFGVFGPVVIKRDTIGGPDPVDWWYSEFGPDAGQDSNQWVDQIDALKKGDAVAGEWAEERDGLYEKHDHFLVWDVDDVRLFWEAITFTEVESA